MYLSTDDIQKLIANNSLSYCGVEERKYDNRKVYARSIDCDSVDEKNLVKRILKSGDRTIVFWRDGTKTIVKRCGDVEDNDYAAFTAAFAIKVFGTNSALKRMIKNKLKVQKPKKEKKHDLN